MWIRRTSEEIVRLRRRHWLRRAVLMSVMLCTLCFAGPYVGKGGGLPGKLLSWEQKFYLSLAIGFVVGILSYAIEGGFGCFPVSDHVTICNTCHKIVTGKKDMRCECGGVYENFDEWTWEANDSDDMIDDAE